MANGHIATFIENFRITTLMTLHGARCIKSDLLSTIIHKMIFFKSCVTFLGGERNCCIEVRFAA